MNTGTNTRRVVVGLGSMVAGAALLVGALPGGASAAPAGQASSTSSTLVDGNPTCEDLGYDFGVKIESQGEVPDTGEYSGDDFDGGDGGTGIVVTITDVEEGEAEDPATVSLTTSFAVDAVIVKSGNGAIVYTAEPPATMWTNLKSPNPSISHIDICWNKGEETTTTTGEDTTTTTEKHETTTTEKHETTTTMAKETTTTVEGETTTTMAAAVTTTTPEGQLPRTGSSTGPLVALGALLLAGGTALVAGTKLRRSQQ